MSKITANVGKIKTLRSNNAVNYNNFISELQSISLEFIKNKKHMQEQLLLINSQITQIEALIEELNYKIKTYGEVNNNITQSNLYREAEIHHLQNAPVKKTIEKADGTKEDYYEVDNEKINKIKNEIENDKQRYSLNEGKILNAKNLKDKILFMLSKLQSIQFNIDRCITLYESFIEKNRTLIGFAENEAAHNNNKLDSVLDALTKYTSCDGFEFLRQAASMGDVILDNNSKNIATKTFNKVKTIVKNNKTMITKAYNCIKVVAAIIGGRTPINNYSVIDVSQASQIVVRVNQNGQIDGGVCIVDKICYVDFYQNSPLEASNFSASNNVSGINSIQNVVNIASFMESHGITKLAIYDIQKVRKNNGEMYKYLSSHNMITFMAPSKKDEE